MWIGEDFAELFLAFAFHASGEIIICFCLIFEEKQY